MEIIRKKNFLNFYPSSSPRHPSLFNLLFIPPVNGLNNLIYLIYPSNHCIQLKRNDVTSRVHHARYKTNYKLLNH